MADTQTLAPLVSADVDLRDFAFMPLHVRKLRDSDIVLIATGDEFRAAVLLWSAAWHEVPAASLPNDDRVLARFAGYGRDMKGWRRVKEMALHGFELCSDGRLYHPLIADLALEAFKKKRQITDKMRNVTNARMRKRAEQRDVNDTFNNTLTKGQGQGQGQGIDREKDKTLSSPAKLPREAGLGLEGLETKLREAAGWQNEPHPGVCVTGPIMAVIEAGASLEADVLPVIRSLAPRVNARSGWKYFIGPIRDAMTARLAAGAPMPMSADIDQRKQDALRFLAEHRAKHGNG